METTTSKTTSAPALLSRAQLAFRWSCCIEVRKRREKSRALKGSSIGQCIIHFARARRMMASQAPHPLRPWRSLLVFADLYGRHDPERVDWIDPAATPDQRLVRQVCRAISYSTRSLPF